MAAAKPKETPKVDLPKLKKELHKGYRSTLIAIKNGTKEPIVRKGPEPQINGKWVQPPPEMINAGSVAFFGAVAKGILGGTDGKVVYTIPGLDGEYLFVWNNAKEKEKRGWSHTATDELKDSAYQVFEEGQGDKHQEVSWTIGNAPSLLMSFESSEQDAALPVPMSGMTKFNSPVLGELAAASASESSLPGAAGGGDDGWGDDGFGDEGRERRITVNIKSAAPLADNTEELKSVAQAFRPAPKGVATRVKGGRAGPPTLTRDENATITKGLFVTATDSFKAAQASFRAGLVALEAGSLKSALEQFTQTLTTISRLPDSAAHKQPARQAARYRVATQLLLKAQEVESKQADLLPLLTFLAVLPLRADHRIVNMRRLVSENMKAGNYAIASRFLKLLVPLNLRDSAKLSEKLKECEEKLKKQASDPSATEEKSAGKFVRFDHTTLKRITGAAVACSYCAAIFDAAGAKAGDKCSYCTQPDAKLEAAA